MEIAKIKQFLDLYKKAESYEEKFLALYDGLHLVFGDKLWDELEKKGIPAEKLKDALRYVRNDEEQVGKTRLSDIELGKMATLLSSSLLKKPF